MLIRVYSHCPRDMMFFCLGSNFTFSAVLTSWFWFLSRSICISWPPSFIQLDKSAVKSLLWVSENASCFCTLLGFNSPAACLVVWDFILTKSLADWQDWPFIQPFIKLSSLPLNIYGNSRMLSPSERIIMNYESSDWKKNPYFCPFSWGKLSSPWLNTQLHISWCAGSQEADGKYASAGTKRF